MLVCPDHLPSIGGDSDSDVEGTPLWSELHTSHSDERDTPFDDLAPSSHLSRTQNTGTKAYSQNGHEM